jgi:tetratricopeptide (TPR) repeat protein
MKRFSLSAPALLFMLASTSFAQLRPTPVLVNPDARRALNSQTDVLGQEVLAEGEPSFKKVARYFPPMYRPKVPISVKDHPDEFITGFDGSLMLRAGEEINFRIGNPPNPYGVDGAVQRSLLDGYLPIPQTRWTFDGLAYEETVFGYSKNLSADEPLQAYVRFRVTNLSSTSRDARVTMLVLPTFKMNANPSQSASVIAGGHTDFYFRIPYYTDSARIMAETATINASDYEAKLAEVRTCWHSYLDSGTQVETPEPFINDAWRAWELYNTLNVDKVKGRYEVHDGSGFYEQEFGYSVGLYCQALSMLGHHEDAQRYIESMLAVQKASGQYITVYGTPDNGALLYAIGQEYRLSHNDAWLRRVLPKALKSMEWVRDSRAETRVLKSGQRPLGYGLLPAGPAYCDFQNSVVSYYSDTYNWLGLHEMAVALKEAGMQKEAADWWVEANAYHQDILQSMQAAVFKEDGIDVLPVEPLTHRLEKMGAINYYSLIAPLILETEFFSAADPHYRWIADFMEQRSGLLLGLPRLWDGGTDHAYAYGYAVEQLRHGNVDAFLLSFYSSLAYGMTRDTFSAVEENGITEGFNMDTLPHTYSNTQQLRMLRMMLVKEEAGELWIAPGVPKAWLDTSNGFALTRAETNYGTISYRVLPEPAAKQVKVTIENEFRNTPAKARVRLAANFGTLQSATVNGSAAQIEHDSVVIDGSKLSGKVEIVAQYR